MAKEILHKRATKNTPLQKLRRILEGLFVQLKNVSIFIYKHAGNIDRISSISYSFTNLDFLVFSEKSKARTKFRRKLTEIKKKAINVIALINSSSDIQSKITFEDFDKGIFPWQITQPEDTAYPTRNLRLGKIIFIKNW